jgi:predicted nucleotidyltransferase
MKPSEDERYAFCYRRKAMKYFFSCFFFWRFRRKKVSNIISDVLQKELEGKEYDEEDAKIWSTTIADLVKARIKSASEWNIFRIDSYHIYLTSFCSDECNFPRYKIVVQAFIGQQRLQDVRIASRCLWDNDQDNHASATFNSVSRMILLS